MKILGRDFDDIPGTSEYVNDWEEMQVSASMTHEQIGDLKRFGLDSDAITNSAIANELYMAIGSLVSRTAGNKRSEDINIGELNSHEGLNKLSKWLIKEISKSYPKFIIVNAQIGTLLQDCDQFFVEELNANNNPGALYKIGMIADTQIFIDPRKQWSNNEIVIVEKDFLEYDIDESTTQIIVEGTSEPKIAGKCRYRISDVKSKVFNIIDDNINTEDK